MTKFADAMWDTVKGRQLYDQGMPWADIAERLQIHKLALISYAKRHGWPSRNAEPEMLRAARGRPRAAPRARRLQRGESTLPGLSSLTQEV